MASQVHVFVFGMQEGMTRFSLTRAEPKSLEKAFALALREDYTVASSYLLAALQRPRTSGPERMEIDAIDASRGRGKQFSRDVRSQNTMKFFGPGDIVVKLADGQPQCVPDATHAGQTTSDDYSLLAVGVDQIQAYVQYHKHLKANLLPVFADPQFRLAFRLLPVRSRFWFLEASNPRIRLCVCTGCGAIETEKHLFFDCTLAVQLWEHIHQIMSPFLRLRATWFSIELETQPGVREAWKDNVEAVYGGGP
ncbi:unnamed protein product [Peronospora destructor]|uniref:Reverse transcriptase zinc-binding domain-containing protein n=1 Tax=Peronospora destructor TaxID=86335 RepID=A0AAV0TLZ5_9STRA|nr:unnamed protein product [Peronospora destructor]